ncbi:MAG: hypothetical protein J0I29_06620 [Rhizobiales bacterium]|nr:hypothetical protein [Hyphomicrobiales bacterium]
MESMLQRSGDLNLKGSKADPKADSGVTGFIVAQLAGMVAAVIVGKWLWVSSGDGSNKLN